MLKKLDSTCKKGTYASSRLKKFISKNSFFKLKFRKEVKEGRSGFAKPGKPKSNATNQGIANFSERKKKSEESKLEKVLKKLIRITVQGVESKQKELNKQRNR